MHAMTPHRVRIFPQVQDRAVRLTFTGAEVSPDVPGQLLAASRVATRRFPLRLAEEKSAGGERHRQRGGG